MNPINCSGEIVLPFTDHFNAWYPAPPYPEPHGVNRGSSQIINGDRDMSSTVLSIKAEAITYDGESVQFPTAGITPIPVDETLFENPSNEELACYGNLCLQTDPHSYSVGDSAIGDEDIDPDEDDF